MNIILQLKHWQILLIGFIVSIFLYISFSTLFAVFLFLILCISIWYYYIATKLNKKNIKIKMLDIIYFQLVFWVGVSNLLFIMLLDLGIINIDKTEYQFFFNFIFQATYIYICWFIAKSLKSIELKKEATVSEYIISLILLWMLVPIGIWFIQPRINKVFRQQ